MHSFELWAEDGLTRAHWDYLARRHPRLDAHDWAARLLCDIIAGFLVAWGADDATVRSEIKDGKMLLEVSAPTAERLAFARERLFCGRDPQGVAGVVDLLMRTEPSGGFDWHNAISARDRQHLNRLLAAMSARDRQHFNRLLAEAAADIAAKG